MKTRRQFIKRAVGSIISIGFLCNPFFSIIRLAIAKTRQIILPKGTKRESLINKNPAELDTRNLETTPLEDFGTMGLDDHKVDLDAWRLEVNGHVKSQLNLTYKEITTMPSLEKEVLLICPGFFANYGRWKGISMRELLRMAGWKRDATHVTIRGPKSVNENTERFPITDILDDRVFLAYQVNGKTLPGKHGFPLRVVAEGYYGYNWVKYVHNMTVEKIGQ